MKPTRRPWRRCGACSGVCHWEGTAWVCENPQCGSEWTEEFDRRQYAAPGGDKRPEVNE